jgi:hypothetical protein
VGQIRVTFRASSMNPLIMEAMLGRAVITMSSDGDDETMTVTGTVESIEDITDDLSTGWRITVVGEDSNNSLVAATHEHDVAWKELDGVAEPEGGTPLRESPRMEAEFDAWRQLATGPSATP